MTQFTASEVRDYLFSIEERSSRQWLIAHDAELGMLRQFADLLEAREKAVPVAYAEFADNGCVRMWSRGYEERSPGTRMVPLYTHPAPSDAERLAEALREFDGAFHKELADLTRIPEDDRGRINRLFAMDCVVGLRRCWDKLSTSRNTHSTQAQPPAASVTEVAELTWEPPDVTINVEQVGRFRSGDEHIVRVTFRSSDDGRRMTCFYSANESAVGYLHAMLAAQENPNA